MSDDMETTRRSVLATIIAGMALGQLPGVSADDGDTAGDRLNVRERPFAHVLAPRELIGRNVKDNLESPPGTEPAVYVDLEQIRTDVDDDVRASVLQDEYPQVMVSIKGGAERPDEVAYDDVVDAVYGKCGEGLVRTTHGYGTLERMLHGQGFEEDWHHQDWTVFDGTGDRGLPDTDMKVALHGTNVAYVTETDSDDEDNNALKDLDDGLYSLIDVLNGEEWLSLSGRNDHARYSEREFHDFGDRSWDKLQQRAIMGESPLDGVDTPYPSGSEVILTDYDGDQRVIKKLTRTTEFQFEDITPETGDAEEY